MSAVSKDQRILWVALCFTSLILLTLNNPASALVCYCKNSCPDDNLNGTCTVNEKSYCYASITLVYHAESASYVEVKRWGCLSEGETGLMQCRSYLKNNYNIPHNVSCCREYDQCNKDLELILNTPAPVQSFTNLQNPVLYIALPVVFVSVLAVVMYFAFRIKRQADGSSKSSYTQCNPFRKDPILKDGDNLSALIEQSSGSGSGLPLLVQRTIAKQIQFVQCIGFGRFGEVWLARWRDEKIAVKVFFTLDEASWYRETEIYQTVLLRHNNILGFIAADIKGNGSWTQMLLITDFHENGSLFDYLRSVAFINRNTCAKMAYSIVAGICHLHTEIFGTKGKPGIAHRDIKSKNILVKKNGECCIADFGLAVKYSSASNTIDKGFNPKAGTRRYMAPEILNGNINMDCFDDLKYADIYSLSLVFWELARRCASDCGEKSLMTEEYEVPYHDCVPPDPTIEEMKAVVCDKAIRPNIPARWNDDPVLKPLSQIIIECWNHKPAVRLTSLRIKKTLKKINVPDDIKMV